MMHNIKIFFAAFAVFITGFFAFQEWSQNSKNPAVKILFIGNSYTFVHNVPGVLLRIAKSKGHNVEVAMAVKPGATFEDHIHDSETLSAIGSEPWNFVVLQEQGQRPAMQDWQREKQFISVGMQLVQNIHIKAPQAQILIYSAWARKTGDQQNCNITPEVCTYEGMQRRVNEGYRQLATRAQATIVPVGRVWQHVRQTAPQIELYEPDLTHQSVAGAYLSAATFYKTIFHDNVVGASAIGIDNPTAQVIQTAVDSFAF